MESTNSGWWRRHGWTVAILLAAFGISFAIRTIWAYPVVSQWGPLFTYAGGSDSYYHSRVMSYIIQTHTNLIRDPLLKFPIGAINPREPLFDWMNAILGIVFAPFFGGNANVAGAWFLDLQAPFWAALGVFPVYLIGREVSGRRTGLIAALIFPFLSANIDSSIFGYANYLSFYTFIVLVVVYSYIRTVKAVGSRRWVENYRKPGQYLPALRAFLRTERSAVKWAVFTGVSLGALALAWQGYTYAVVVIAISVLVAMVIERIRRVDSFGLYVTTWIVGLVGFPMAMPYYIVQQQFTQWFDLPLLLYFGVLVLLFPFLLMRDVPWVFSLPLLVGVVAGGVGALALVSPTDFSSIVTGQGYFVKTLIYSTVAEAQAPSIDALVLGYGVVTFFLAFVGLALFVWTFVRGRFKRHHVVFLVFAIVSIYLPISAAKFFLIGSPIFALLPAEAFRRALDIAGFGELRRTTASLSDRRSQFSAFRKAFKPRHVLIMILVVGIVLPNVWVAIDAGIPGNTKSGYAAQVGASIPSWLQLNSSNPSQYYFGAAGTSLDTPDTYDSAGYNWLAQQDTNLPPAERPAFVSWWDYGFQAIDQGGHPSVADNFQNGIDPAGQFLLAQNESQAIGVLATTLLQGEQLKTGLNYLPASLNSILAADGLDVSTLHNLLVNQSADYNLVVANPDRYLPVNPRTLTDQNAMYLAMAYYFATALPLSGVAKVYDDIQSYTGWTIRYAMTDTRLFPFSGTDTGIFYAPADLTGRVLDANGEPETFFNLSQLGSDGNYYPYGNLPAGVSAVGAPVINYKAPFFDSMIYRIYIGYNGTDAGESAGIPGLSLNATIEPGWMLQHFQVVYKTAYLCSRPNFGGTCVATNTPTALSQAAKINGSADTSPNGYFSGGETMLEYYPGQTLLGEVQLPNGAPVGGARVTVYDGWNIPHQTVLTAPDGSFSLVLPPGNDTVNVTMGSFDGLAQADSVLLKSVPIPVSPAVGLSFNSPNLVQTITVPSGSLQGFVYWKSGNGTAYVPNTDKLVPGAQVVFWGSNLTRLTATTDASGSFDLPAVAPGVYHYNVVANGVNLTQSDITVASGTPTNATVGLTSASLVAKVLNPSGSIVVGALVSVATSAGVVASATTYTQGTALLSSIGPGNYTVTATTVGTDLRSAGVPLTVGAGNGSLSLNLTLYPSGTSTIVVTSNGVPVPGVAVRFTPVPSFVNASISPLRSLSEATSNGTVLLSSSTGTVVATLPEGSYSVYATGLIGGQPYAALGSTTVTAGVSSLTVGLALTPALSLTGTVSSSATSGSTTAVVAYAPGGDSVVGWTRGGSFRFSLPSGSYTLLALQGTTTSASQIWAGLASVSLPSSASVAIAPVLALRTQFTVGATLASGAVEYASSAAVSVSAGPTGPAAYGSTDTNGSVALFLPSSLPLSAGSYCLSTSAVGFASSSSCAYTPSSLANLTHVSVGLRSVAVSVSVLGLPSGTPVQVNFTAQSSTAVNRTLWGGPTFALTLPPGVYGITARATVGAGNVVYLPSGSFSTTLPLGSSSSNITITLLAQVNGTGTLVLPSALKSDNVTVALTSPGFTTIVDGATYEAGFRVPAGLYSAYATGNVSGAHYVSLLRVVVAASGTITPSISLTTVSPTIAGSVVNSAGGALKLNTTVTLVAPSGAAATAPVTNGSFSLALNPSTTYSVFVNASTVASGPNGSYVQDWSAVAGSTCALGFDGSVCTVSLVSTPQTVTITGTLVAAGVPGPVPGTVRLVGPYPSTAVTSVNAPSGSFSAALLPGAYSLYAVGGGPGASTLGNLTSVLALPSSPSTYTVTLAPTWVDTITVLPPNGTSAGLGPATVTVTNALGVRAEYTGLATNAPFQLALPQGTYSLRAFALGILGGVVTNSLARSNVTLSNGNVGSTLTLAYSLTSAVTGTLVGPSSATVAVGHNATFAFAVRNTGNIPVTVTPIGTPAYWNFSFSFTSVTLQPGSSAASASGEARVWVPWGTAVNHPGVTIEFETANGTIVGSVAPAPTINVVGYYGIRAGAASAPVEVGLRSATVPVYLVNTGNLGETAVAAVANTGHLATLGWSAAFGNRSSDTSVSQYLSAGQNVTLNVTLTSSSTIFVPPASITVAVSVLNASGSVSATAVLSVPSGSVRAGSTSGVGGVTVTGPSVGTAPNLPPDWLIPLLSFVPAIALVVGVLTYRWWRTRRWTRR